MKKTTVFLIALLGFILFVGASVALTSKMIIKVSDTDHEKTISLQLANLHKHFTNVYIAGFDGKVWYSDFIWNKNGYSANIDLTALEAGDYMMGIRNKKETALVALFVTKDQVVHVNANKPGLTLRKTARYLPTPFSRLLAHFYVEDSQPVLNIQLANLNEGETSIRLAAVGGFSLYNERFSGATGYHKALNMTDAANGAYYLYLNTVEAKVLQMIEVSNGTVRLGPTMGKERALLQKRQGVAAK